MIFFNYIYVSHPDNSIEFDGANTPLHILPEWYFMYLFTVLKILPSKESGLAVVILIFIYLGLVSYGNPIKCVDINSRLCYLFNMHFSFGMGFLVLLIIMFILGLYTPTPVLLMYGQLVVFSLNWRVCSNKTVKILCNGRSYFQVKHVIHYHLQKVQIWIIKRSTISRIQSMINCN